jgi:DNA-binding NarL/FixJ family response regulator
MAAGLQVMVVDDHKIFRIGMVSILQAIPGVRKIYEAENGAKAVEQVASHSIDVVLMDIRMPVMNGLEATSLILKSKPGVKVVALTMFDDSEFLSEMFNRGASGYLLKNTDAEEIQDAIETVLAGESYFSRDITEAMLTQLLSVQQAPRFHDGTFVPTGREKQILKLICDGLSAREIGETLGISPRTVEGHRSRILYKTNCRNIAELVKYAIRNGLQQP